MKLTFATTIIVTTLSVLTAHAAPPAANSWTNGTGKWETGGNWSLGIPPATTQSAIFVTNGVSKTVTIDATTSSSSPGTLTVSNLTVAAPLNSTNTLTLNNAGLAQPLRILNGATIETGGSLFLTNAAVTVGGLFRIIGSANMVDGSITATNSVVSLGLGQRTGCLTVSGGTVLAGYLFVGLGSDEGESVLTVAGGTVSVAADLKVGTFDWLNKKGSVWVTGGQLVVTNGTTYIGPGGQGAMTVSNGVVLARDVSFSAGSTLTIAGGTEVLSGNLGVGGGGTVGVTGGQLAVTNGTTTIGAGTGQMVVSGGTVWASDVYVGADGGTLTVDGGVETVLSSLVIGDCGGGATGAVTVAGGSLFITNAAHDAVLEVRNGTLALNSGTLTVDRLVITNACGLFVRGGGTLVAGSIVLDPNLDADGDGIPTGWEQTHGLDPLNAADGYSGPTNSWTAGSGKWELAGNWSAGVPPFVTQLAILITNDVGKTISIDALTSSNSPDALFIRTLILSAPGASINTLLLTNAGTNVPLHVLGDLGIGQGGNLVVTNSAVSTDGSLHLDGNLALSDALLICSNGTTYVALNSANSELTVSNSTVLAGSVYIARGGALQIAGGVTTLASGLSISSNAAVWMISGQLTVTNGATDITGSGGQMAVSNGTVLAQSVTVGDNGALRIVGGTTALSADIGDRGAIWVSGGQLVVTNGLIHLGDSSAAGSFTVSNGTVRASYLDMGVDTVASDNSLAVAGGTASFSDGLAANAGSVWVSGGALAVSNGPTSIGGGSPGLGQMTVSNGAVQVRDVAVWDTGTLTVAGGTVTLSSSLDDRGAVWVTGGELVATNDQVRVGFYTDAGYITVSNGTMLAGYTYIGIGTKPSDSALTVAGGTLVLSAGLTADDGGSLWISGGKLVATNATILLGTDSQGGSMTVSNGEVAAGAINVGPRAVGTLTLEGGAVNVYSNLSLGSPGCGGFGQVVMNGGNLLVTNAAHEAVLEVLTGLFTLNSGYLKLDRLVITNACGLFIRNGGTLDIGTLVLDPGLDADGDGLPNSWEQTHGFNPFNAADGQTGSTNSWTGGSGRWETGNNWWLAVPPAIAQSVILITNAGNNTVTIDALTSGNAPATMVIRNLTLSAPAESTNTLSLTNAGAAAPWDVASVAIGPGGRLLVTNSAVLVGGSLNIEGGLTMLGGVLTATNGTTYLGGNGLGELTVSNGTVQARYLSLGVASGTIGGTLTVAGGALSLSADLNLGNGGAVWVTDGQLAVTNGVISIGDWPWWVECQMVVSHGTVHAKNLSVGPNGTLLMTGGLMPLSSELDVNGPVWVTGGQLVVTNGATDIEGGQMSVSNGVVLAGAVYLGTNFYQSGALTVSAGTETIFSRVVLGNCADGGGWGGLTVDGGSLFITNSAHDAVLEIHNGLLTINSGTLTVDRLVMTDPCGQFVRGGGTLSAGNVVLDPNPDTDGDGLPNGYEQSHGLDPLNAADVNLDSDGDGLTNWQEFLAGTNPNDPNSAFRPTAIAMEGDDVRVAWTMGAGKTNVLQAFTGTISSGFTTNFVDLFTVTNTVGSVTNYLDRGGATNTPGRVYRVRLVR